MDSNCINLNRKNNNNYKTVEKIQIRSCNCQDRYLQTFLENCYLGSLGACWRGELIQ